MKKGYTIIAFLEAKPKKIDELKQALLASVEPSRKESSCVEYRLHQDLDNPALFVFYEIWRCKEALAGQLEKHAFKSLSTKLMAW